MFDQSRANIMLKQYLILLNIMFSGLGSHMENGRAFSNQEPVETLISVRLGKNGNFTQKTGKFEFS